MNRCLLLCYFILFSTVVSAQDFRLGGYSKIFMHPNLNSPYRFDKLGTRLQLKFSGSVSESVAFFSAVDFDWNIADSLASRNMRVYPVESYVDLFFDWLDIRIGNQFIFWGKTDWINPTDNINPWDYVNISAEIEDYRIPVTSAKFNFYITENLSLEFVWIPVFRHHVIPIELPAKMGPFDVVIANDKTPIRKISSSEIAFRISSQLPGIDYSLSYYHGYDKSPSLFSRTDFSQGTPQIIFTPEYKKINIFGADFVTTFESFALKGEGAYFNTEDEEGENIFIENNHLKYVLGCDYYVNDEMSLNFQFVQNLLFNYDKKYEIAERTKLGMPVSEIPEKSEQSVSAMIKYNFSDFADLQFISVVNLKDYDFFVLPIINYSFADGVNFYFGATIFGGKENSPFGRSKKYSRGFFELKYSF